MSGLPLFGLALVLLAVLLAMGLEVALAIGGVGIAGLYYLGGVPQLGDVGLLAFNTSTSWVLTTVPLFVFMGSLLFRMNLSAPMFDAGVKWFNWLPAGPLIGTLAAVGVFSAVSGSSTACAATFGTVAIPELEDRRNYDRQLVYGSLAAGSTLSIMIPPSLAMIIYASVTSQSVGQLFAAGLLPGLMILALMSLYIIGVVRWRPSLAPASADDVTWRDRFISLLELIPAASLIALVLGGIYLGFMTPTESAAVGCSGTVVIAALTRRFSFRALIGSLLEAVRLTCFIMLIVVSAYVFGQFVSKAGFPQTLAGDINKLNVPNWVIVALILLLYMILGAVMEAISILVITLPIVFPTILALGYNPIWFGVLTVLAVEISLITPPLGLNLFIIHGVNPNRKNIQEVFRGALPFIAVLLCALVLLVAFPQIALWLPSHLNSGL